MDGWRMVYLGRETHSPSKNWDFLGHSCWGGGIPGWWFLLPPPEKTPNLRPTRSRTVQFRCKMQMRTVTFCMEIAEREAVFLRCFCGALMSSYKRFSSTSSILILGKFPFLSSCSCFLRLVRKGGGGGPGSFLHSDPRSQLLSLSGALHQRRAFCNLGEQGLLQSWLLTQGSPPPPASSLLSRFP